MIEISLVLAFAAGALSFLSPCVLPLVPPYMVYLAGGSLDDLKDKKTITAHGKILFSACCFVAGFSTVFILLGLGASALGQVLRSHIVLLSQIAGGVIILFGLHFLGVFKLAGLYRSFTLETTKPAGPIGAYIMGLAFAFGWTPCIGPVLAAILAVAASSSIIGEGALLLAIYSAGLGVPFLIAALAINPFLRLVKKMGPYYVWIERSMGVLLIFTGIAFITGWIQLFAFWLLEQFPILATFG